MSEDYTYQQFLSAEHGAIRGVPNLVIGVVSFVILVTVIGGIIYYIKHKKKKEAKELAKNNKSIPSKNQVDPTQPTSIYDEIEGEIELYEKQKKKLSMYLGYLLTRDGENVRNANENRWQKAAARVKMNRSTFLA